MVSDDIDQDTNEGNMTVAVVLTAEQEQFIGDRLGNFHTVTSYVNSLVARALEADGFCSEE